MGNIFSCSLKKKPVTGKSLSEALIFASNNPQYDHRLLIELQLQYVKTTISEHVVYMNCSECQNQTKEKCVHNKMFWACIDVIVDDP